MIKCDRCKNYINDKPFVDFYNYRGKFFKCVFVYKKTYGAMRNLYTKFDMVICNNCFIYKNYYPNKTEIIVPEYLPVEQHKMWLKKHLIRNR